MPSSPPKNNPKKQKQKNKKTKKQKNKKTGRPSEKNEIVPWENLLRKKKNDLALESRGMCEAVMRSDAMRCREAWINKRTGKKDRDEEDRS
jgi:hypothetical protein